MNSYLLPVVISDNDYPIQSSTSTLTVRVCACDSRGNVQTCSTEALLLSAGLSTGALVAILLCILILLSKCWTPVNIHDWDMFSYLKTFIWPCMVPPWTECPWADAQLPIWLIQPCFKPPWTCLFASFIFTLMCDMTPHHIQCTFSKAFHRLYQYLSSIAKICTDVIP